MASDRVINSYDSFNQQVSIALPTVDATGDDASSNGFFILDNGWWWLSRVSNENESYETKLMIILIVVLTILTITSILIICWVRGQKLLSILCCNYYLCSLCRRFDGDADDKDTLKEVTSQDVTSSTTKIST